MKILIAPDSFKGSLSATEAAKAMAQGLLRVWPRARIRCLPMADGGEGTLKVLTQNTPASVQKVRVMGAVQKSTLAPIALFDGRQRALIEVASVCGLARLPLAQRNPMKTTSFGVGELILNALDRGAEEILLALGGSATVDAGMGLAQALGARFLDARGRVIRQPGCGGLLKRIKACDWSGLDDRLKRTQFILLRDVDNPLCGPVGAAQVFGPQKGATPRMVRELDAGLSHFADLIDLHVAKSTRTAKGAGAAGGLGFALQALLRARSKPGIEVVADWLEVPKHMAWADWVLTGEGCIDGQTAYGKVVAGLAKIAKREGVPLIAIGGGLTPEARALYGLGVQGLESATAMALPMSQLFANAAPALVDAAERVARLLKTGEKLAQARFRKN